MTTETNGVRIVTYVIPLEQKMESPDLKTSLVKQEKSNLPPRTRMFLKGKPMPLGVRAGHGHSDAVSYQYKYKFSFIDRMLIKENNLNSGCYII